MGYQTDVKIGGPIPLPASSGLVGVASTAAGRGVLWDSANAVLELAGDDDRVDFIVEEVDTDNNVAHAIPFTADRQFRARLSATPGTLAKGKLVKISANGLFMLGGTASDVNVAVCEQPSTANAAALVRPLGATITS